MPKSNLPYHDRSRNGQHLYLRQLRRRNDGPNVGIRAEEENQALRGGGNDLEEHADDAVVAAAQEERPLPRELEAAGGCINAPVGPAPEAEANDDTDDDDSEADNAASGESDDEEAGPERNDPDSDQDEVPDHGAEGEGGAGLEEPIYEGAPVTVQEALLAILSLQITHNLTSACVSDILRYTNLLCPRQTLSLYKFRKFFHCSQTPSRKHYYCSACSNSLDFPEAVCAVCNERKGSSYFVQLSLAPQLREMFKRDSFYDDLQLRFTRDRVEAAGALCDIYDGSVYKEDIRNEFLLNPNHISLTWYTDGASPFASKNYSIWPFLLIINELPYKKRVRRENTLLAGLWFGPNKPSANMFMRSFIPDLRSLYHGIQIEVPSLQRQVLVRGKVIAGVCDTPAKSCFMNMKGHRGFYGCPVCEIRGETLRRPHETNKFVFRYEAEMTLRTVERHQEQAIRAADVDVDVHGVKGGTVLRLFMPDFLKGMAIDPMHAVTGVTKKLLTLHFSEKCHGYPFSRRPVLGVADTHLKRIKPPKFIHRRPSSLEHYKRWKASELMSWLFFYSVPIYKAILDPEFFDNYLKFVTAIALLNSDCVRPHDVDVAEMLLNDFVRDFEELYGAKFCSINIHLLRHLPLCVRRLGPLWAYTCFPMENLNGIFLGTLHGKTNIDSQLCNMFWQVLKVQIKFDRIESEELEKFISKRRHSVHIGEQISPSCYIVGWEVDGPVHPVVPQTLRAMGVALGRISVYFRLLKNSMIYSSEGYTRDVAHNSRVVMYTLAETNKIGSVICYVKITRCNCDGLCQCAKEHFAIIRLYEKVGDIRLPQYGNLCLKHLIEMEPTMQTVAIPVPYLKTVCVCVTAFNSLHVAVPVNTHEVEV